MHDEVIHAIGMERYRATLVIGVVLCLHAVMLLLMLRSAAVHHEEISLPSIAGVLIHIPSTEQVKARKATPKPVAKRMPVPKKAITLPQQKKQSPVKEIQEEVVEVAEEETVAKPAPIVAPHVDASRLINPAPVYPRASLRRREEGKVILELLILADGSVGEIRIKQSSGYKRLDRSAVKAVKRWRYIPAKKGNHTIEHWYEQPIVFSLRK